MRILRTSNPWFISGRCDGVITFESGEKQGVEFKSMHKEGFNRLYDGPLYEHRVQANIYQKLLGLPIMSYMYINKDNSALKVFNLRFDKSLFENIAVRIERILLGLKKGKLPKRIKPGCVDPKCKFNVVCNSGKTVRNLMQPETISELKFWKPTILAGEEK
jgi:hypothetical protein